MERGKRQVARSQAVICTSRLSRTATMEATMLYMPGRPSDNPCAHCPS
jgi:hypothetical protein